MGATPTVGRMSKALAIGSLTVCTLACSDPTSLRPNIRNDPALARALASSIPTIRHDYRIYRSFAEYKVAFDSLRRGRNPRIGQVSLACEMTRIRSTAASTSSRITTPTEALRDDVGGQMLPGVQVYASGGGSEAIP